MEKDIKQIIANNLISLRKKHNFTQNELAKKINYSDNAVSRWERAELSPSIEVLVSIAEVYNVPVEYFLKEHIVIDLDKEDRINKVNKFATTLLSVLVVWIAVTVGFVYYNTFFGVNIWRAFVWAVPISCVLLLFFSRYWNNRIYKFVVLTILNWSALVSVYLQLLEYNMWLVFIIGVPIQAALAVSTFIRQKK